VAQTVGNGGKCFRLLSRYINRALVLPKDELALLPYKPFENECSFSPPFISWHLNENIGQDGGIVSALSEQHAADVEDGVTAESRSVDTVTTRTAGATSADLATHATSY
jgi:hypothetical protein